MLESNNFFEVSVKHKNYTDNRDLKPLCIKIAEKTMETGLKKSPLLSSFTYPIEAGIILTDDSFIQSLNFKYRGKNIPTNVLSFALLDGKDTKTIMEEAEIFSTLILGDIVISLDTIEKEAKEFAIKFEDRLALIVIHGILHLIGFDHENEKDAEIMEKLESFILADLGFANSYN